MDRVNYILLRDNPNKPGGVCIVDTYDDPDLSRVVYFARDSYANEHTSQDGDVFIFIDACRGVEVARREVSIKTTKTVRFTAAAPR